MKKSKGWLKKAIWFVVFVALAALSIQIVISQNEDFSLEMFWNDITTATPIWLLAAGACMVGFVFFEGESMHYLLGFLGHKTSRKNCFVYAASDIYFSAITPSATGGQPASAFCMMRDGLPAAATTMVLLMNLMMYNVSLMVLAFLCFIICPSVYLHFDTFAHILIWAGIATQTVMTLVFFLLAFKAGPIIKLADWGLRLLARLHLIKNPEERRQGLEKMADEYKGCISQIWHHSGVVIRTFIYNFLQRLSQLGVSVFVFLALNGAPIKLPDVFVTQSFAVLGSNSVPIPGAVGVADYLFINGFKALVSEDLVVHIELLTRGISFYFCIFMCGLTVLANYAILAIRNRKAKKKAVVAVAAEGAIIVEAEPIAEISEPAEDTPAPTESE